MRNISRTNPLTSILFGSIVVGCGLFLFEACGSDSSTQSAMKPECKELLACCSSIQPEDGSQVGTAADCKKLAEKDEQESCSAFLSELKEYNDCKPPAEDKCIEAGKECSRGADTCCGDLVCDGNTLPERICRTCSGEGGACKQTKDCCEGQLCSSDGECYEDTDDE